MAGDETDMAGDDDVFCGPMSMDMNMQGFFSMFDDKPMCVNFLFRTWSLDTRTKFAFACLGSCAMGAAVELLTKTRRELRAAPLPQQQQQQQQQQQRKRSAAMLSLYGVQVVLGYALMLVIMTYNAELFLCGVAGLIIGHAAWNLDAPVAGKTDACCAYDDLPSGDQ